MVAYELTWMRLFSGVLSSFLLCLNTELQGIIPPHPCFTLIGHSMLTCLLPPVFRFDRQCRDVSPVSVLLAEWGWPFPAPADVILPRTKQKLLLPEGASRGLREGPSLGGSWVRFCYASEQNWQTSLSCLLWTLTVVTSFKEILRALVAFSMALL